MLPPVGTAGHETTNCTAWGLIYTAFTTDSDAATLDGRAGLQLGESGAWENAPFEATPSGNLELGKHPESPRNKRMSFPSDVWAERKKACYFEVMHHRKHLRQTRIKNKKRICTSAGRISSKRPGVSE